MGIFIIILKVIITVSLLNVWLVQYNKPTQWRGGTAQNIVEEFKVYGLPKWMCYLVGILKVSSAIALVASIGYPSLEFPAAATLAVLLAGSISMHFKISDPLKKSFPAALFLSMCLVIIFL